MTTSDEADTVSVPEGKGLDQAPTEVLGQPDADGLGQPDADGLGQPNADALGQPNPDDLVQPDAEPVEPVGEPTLDQVDQVEAESLDLSDPVVITMAVEAVLFISDTGLSAERMAAALHVSVEAVETALARLENQLLERGSGLQLQQLSSGWRLTTHPLVSAALRRFVVEGQSARLSMAALETLAIVAYRQPVSRASIAAIRGVNVDGVVRTLLARGLIEAVGQDAVGATLYCITKVFLDKLGVQDATLLPALAPLLPDLETLDGSNDLAS